MTNSNEKLDYIIQYCACANIRKSARSVTQAYENQMRVTGLKVTQYYMLANIVRHNQISISKLGEMMMLDQTTVTRNVNILRKNGYVTVARDNHDNRTKSISATDVGTAKLEEATPIWDRMQHNIENSIGREKYKEVLKTLLMIREVIERNDDGEG